MLEWFLAASEWRQIVRWSETCLIYSIFVDDNKRLYWDLVDHQPDQQSNLRTCNSILLVWNSNMEVPGRAFLTLVEYIFFCDRDHPLLAVSLLATTVRRTFKICMTVLRGGNLISSILAMSTVVELWDWVDLRLCCVIFRNCWWSRTLPHCCFYVSKYSMLVFPTLVHDDW